jgi:hypothetical protein
MTKRSVFLTNIKRDEFFRMHTAGQSRQAVQDKLRISKSTFYHTLSRPPPSIAALETSGGGKKDQKPKYSEIEQLVLEAFTWYRSLGLPASGPLFQSIARRTATRIIKDPTTPDDICDKYLKATFGGSWLDKIKTRHQMWSLWINGERAKVVAHWEELMTEIGRIIMELGISKERVYNWDETGFFYHSMPKYMLAIRGDDGAGGKENKQRITTLLCVNSDGSDHQVVLISKVAKPRGTNRAFWIESGVWYFANENAWLTCEIFTTLLKEFDLRIQGRGPVVLLLDNFSGHSWESFEILHNVIPIFLPANSTYKTQPLDARVISVFKTKFRRSLMEFICQKIYEGSFRITEITIQLIVPWIQCSLMEIYVSTIERCLSSCLQIPMFDKQTELITPEDNILGLGNAVKWNLAISDIDDASITEFVMGDESENVITEPIVITGKEDVIIENPTKLLKVVDRLIQYFTNTGCPKEVTMAMKMKSRLIQHLNFQ